MARAWAWVLLACAATCAAQTKKGQKDLGFAAPAPAQAWCQSGVSYGKACCDAECKVCGGNGCKGHAVGEERCCAANINAKKRMCTDVQDVVCVIPTSLIESTQVIENRCKEEVDYLKYTRNRLSRWSGNWTISWQQMINNKARLSSPRDIKSNPHLTRPSASSSRAGSASRRQRCEKG
ncbi:hypothetical protein M885DRAFT_24318 [Pelagophyceae sp. CCMP2097]|nr:hypothetical protein M885DRAFT_24318 [Pelagophyceae sp. CCMP2097]